MATTAHSPSAYDLLMRARELMDAGHPHQAAMLLDRAKLIEPEKGSIRETHGASSRRPSRSIR